MMVGMRSHLLHEGNPMKRPKILIQAAVIATSLLLLGGFIGYRAGTFPWLKEAGVRPVERDTDAPPNSGTNEPQAGKQAATPTSTQRESLILMSGSKYIVVPPTVGSAADKRPAIQVPTDASAPMPPAESK
jgi:hypothetical protein